jgi:hypothetical protein
VRSDGATEVVLDGRAPTGEGWALVPEDLTAVVGAHPERYAPTPDRRSVCARAAVRLSLSTDRIRADGEDTAEFMLIADGPEAEALTDIEVRVNGEPVVVQLNEIIPIATTKPGLFRVTLVDPRCFSPDSHERALRAIEPERFQGEVDRVRARRPIPTR